ncbi:MAG: hypothetical protein C0443_06015 [Comamonadaceae bacterium]|nr:hypothetical protein [Comamonadaceae bacterium]
MRRYTVIFVTLFAMLWQSVALARVGSMVAPLADRVHASLHWQEEGHHHHEDGRYHLDDSSESVQHLLTDHLSTAAELMVAASPGFLPLGSVAPDDLYEAPVPNPASDGLLRPPRSAA